MKILILLGALILSSSAFSSYIPFVKSIEQRVINDPRGGSSQRFEGCGPVAAAMLLSYWQGQRDFEIMSEDSFDERVHPTATISDFYKASWTQKAPAKAKAPDGKRYNQSFTLPSHMVRGLKKFVKKSNLKDSRKLVVRRLKAKESSKRKLSVLKELLKKKVPLISLIHNIPACLNSKDNKSGGWHYVVLVGMNEKKKTVDLLSGWKELDASTSTGPEVHQRRNHPDSDKGHVRCDQSELIKANPAFYWIEENDL
ncbi:MAG: hypothetical protein ACJAT2_000483 [Bacteriovoracaceae bacterium]|jgi:hypothetical protein